MPFLVPFAELETRSDIPSMEYLMPLAIEGSAIDIASGYVLKIHILSLLPPSVIFVLPAFQVFQTF